MHVQQFKQFPYRWQFGRFHSFAFSNNAKMYKVVFTSFCMLASTISKIIPRNGVSVWVKGVHIGDFASVMSFFSDTKCMVSFPTPIL